MLLYSPILFFSFYSQELEFSNAIKIWKTRLKTARGQYWCIIHVTVINNYKVISSTCAMIKLLQCNNTLQTFLWAIDSSNALIFDQIFEHGRKPSIKKTRYRKATFCMSGRWNAAIYFGHIFFEQYTRSSCVIVPKSFKNASFRAGWSAWAAQNLAIVQLLFQSEIEIIYCRRSFCLWYHSSAVWYQLTFFRRSSSS